MFAISPAKNKTGNREMPEADGSTDEITENVIIEQDFINATENINEIAIVFDRLYLLDEKCDMVIELAHGNEILATRTINCDDIEGSHRTYLHPESPLADLVGEELTLRIYSKTTWGTGLSLMSREDYKNSTYKFGNKTLNGTICFSVNGKE